MIVIRGGGGGSTLENDCDLEKMAPVFGEKDVEEYSGVKATSLAEEREKLLIYSTVITLYIFFYIKLMTTCCSSREKS